MVPVASTPSITTRPSLGSCNPATMLKMVLLPQPDGPIRLTNEPCGTARLTWSSAWKAPDGVWNLMLRSSIQSLVGEGIGRLRSKAERNRWLRSPQEACHASDTRRAPSAGAPPGSGPVLGFDSIGDCPVEPTVEPGVPND